MLWTLQAASPHFAGARARRKGRAYRAARWAAHSNEVALHVGGCAAVPQRENTRTLAARSGGGGCRRALTPHPNTLWRTTCISCTPQRSGHGTRHRSVCKTARKQTAGSAVASAGPARRPTSGDSVAAQRRARGNNRGPEPGALTFDSAQDQHQSAATQPRSSAAVQHGCNLHFGGVAYSARRQRAALAAAVLQGCSAQGGGAAQQQQHQHSRFSAQHEACSAQQQMQCQAASALRRRRSRRDVPVCACGTGAWHAPATPTPTPRAAMQQHAADAARDDQARFCHGRSVACGLRLGSSHSTSAPAAPSADAAAPASQRLHSAC